MTKREFEEWIRPIVKEIVEETIKDVITKLVFDKAAENVMQTTQEAVSARLSGKTIVKESSDFKKFNFAQQPQQPVQEQQTEKTKAPKAAMFNDIVDSVDPHDVAMSRATGLQ